MMNMLRTTSTWMIMKTHVCWKDCSGENRLPPGDAGVAFERDLFKPDEAANTVVKPRTKKALRKDLALHNRLIAVINIIFQDYLTLLGPV